MGDGQRDHLVINMDFSQYEVIELVFPDRISRQVSSDHPPSPQTKTKKKKNFFLIYPRSFKKMKLAQLACLYLELEPSELKSAWLAY